MRTDALDFELPGELIATTAAEPRDSARLMVIDRGRGVVEHRQVRDLPALVDAGWFAAGDAMVVNRSGVLPAYWEGVREATGGKVTGLYLSSESTGAEASAVWSVMLETKGKPAAGEWVVLDAGLRLRLDARLGPGTWRVLPGDEAGVALSASAAMAGLSRVGRPPLPPYIRKARKAMGLAAFAESDRVRYETVYADAADAGSIAAPTAGLHFTPGLLDALDERGIERLGVSLHVGVGTFLPVRSETLEEHPMHAERFHVSGETLTALRRTHAEGRRRLVIGTTAVRTLESLPHPLPEPAPEEGIGGETNLFIRPDAGFVFRHTDALLTNFHLPRSTLLALVAALPGVGLENLQRWYGEAIAERYRFYSYGDAMLLV